MRSTFLLASFLAIIPIISATPTSPLAARQAIPTIYQTALVTGGSFTFKGCYTDSQTARVLANEVTPSGTVNVKHCMDACAAQNFIFGGIENGGRSCFCDNNFQGDPTAAHVDQSKCQVACLDDPSQACGDFNLELIYSFTKDV